MDAGDVLEFLRSLNPPALVVKVVVGFIIAVFLIREFYQGITFLRKIIQEFCNMIEDLRNPERSDFILLRNLFVQHQMHEVTNLDKEADWNDFNYTELEAEVEVDPDVELGSTRSKLIFILARFFRAFLPRGMYHGIRVERNLSKAILHSKARSFLLIGEPGSGKTVSLRHMFHSMAKRCQSSRDPHATIPIYLNLKHLTMPPASIDADAIHRWIVEELREGQDRTIYDFLEGNFDNLLNQGVFFFLFDAFDEIPAVLDAQEHETIVHQYAQAIDRFVHALHGGRALVASRPYRAPSVFVGEKLTIRALSDKRVKKALGRYLMQKPGLSGRLWHELTFPR